MKKYFDDIKFILLENPRVKNNIHICPVEDDKIIDGYYISNIGLECAKHIYVHKIGGLDFIQEINGFFHTKQKVYINPSVTSIDFDIPNDIEIKEDYNSNYAAGDYVLDPKTLYVYRVYGWDRTNGGGSYFWDFLTGYQSGELKYNPVNDTVTNCNYAF